MLIYVSVKQFCYFCFDLWWWLRHIWDSEGNPKDYEGEGRREEKNELIKKKDEENRAQQQWEQNKEAIQIARRKEKYIEYIDGKKTFEKK